VKTGFVVSNGRDNFSRSLHTKLNLPQLLDDPMNLSKWKQPDWLAWLDLVARGATASTRFENVPLYGFRAIATNKTIGEVFLDSRGQSMTDGEIGAIKNKGVFLDLYDQDKLNQMRKSTWYKDSETGEPVPIMLSIEGESKVRQRFGLSRPEPDSYGVPQPGTLLLPNKLPFSSLREWSFPLRPLRSCSKLLARLLPAFRLHMLLATLFSTLTLVIS
jgi:hypothetical protein